MKGLISFSHAEKEGQDWTINVLGLVCGGVSIQHNMMMLTQQQQQY
jgi:hypothetical protein